MRAPIVVLLVPILVAAPSRAQTAQGSAADLAGLWEAKLRFGPDIRGPLILERASGTWRAEIAGRSTAARLAGDTITFELPDGRGAFRGQLKSQRARIIGHWIQPVTVTNGSAYASPVTLTHGGTAERWRGDVDPLADEFTMYLKVEPRADGTMRAFLVNPERNIGRFTRVASLERAGQVVRLLAAPANGQAWAPRTPTARRSRWTTAGPSVRPNRSACLARHSRRSCARSSTPPSTA